MSCFFQALRRAGRARAGGLGVQEEDVSRWGLTGIKLRPYQLDGVNWLVQCYQVQHGCILGDEMGLGKTCQTISLLLYLTKELTNRERSLILCPLSVLSNWKEELETFAPGLSFVTYIGNKEERSKLQQSLKEQSHFHVLFALAVVISLQVTGDAALFVHSFDWAALVVDEAHRLKNQNSLLYETLIELPVGFSLLLTGTPIQNSLQELYSLLSFIEPDIFPRKQVKEFVEYYQAVEKESEPAKELHSLLQPFLLRRVKSEVTADLPKKVEVVLYHGMSALQRKYYKAILTKDLDAFEGGTGRKVTLQNVLIQLRKCVAHPYLFNGVEPEPFEIGDHIVEASGKLCLLDKLLSFLYDGYVMNIHFVVWKGYSYERLDGSVRGEERHLAIKNFGQQPVFVFLLSTRAGKPNSCAFLSAADAKIVFRLQLFEPVKIIRLIGRDTVEEIIYRRAASKLRLTNAIVEGGQFALGVHKPQEASDLQTLLTGLRDQSTRRKHLLSTEELETRRKKRQEAAAKRAKLMEERRKAKAEAEHMKKMAWWESNHYTSTCLPSEESESEEEFEEGDAGLNVDLDYRDVDLNCIKYVIGDVTHPKAGEEDAIIVHCLDDSGRWGRGGLFTALEARSDQPRKIYEMAGKMKDLQLGGTLLFPIDDKKPRRKGQDLLALIVAQHRDRSNNLSGIKLSALEKGLKKIYLAAKKRNATVHFPRIGYATKDFNWYGTERLIHKYLATRGIPTLIYYFPRNRGSASQPSSSVTASKP
uniref:Chromodomain-helicase-DNA-binding protein 1-like n=1 Tax=Pavo cristatus TaxID=9049 RepID=A0A8C9LBG6_PAVCR